MKKISDAVINEAVKNAKFIKLETKVNKLDKKKPNVTTLIHINQQNPEKQNLEKKMEMLIKNYKPLFKYKTWNISNKSRIKSRDK